MKKQTLILWLAAFVFSMSPQTVYAVDENANVPALVSEQTWAVSGQWVEKDGDTYYQYSDGSYAKGWVVIEGTEYYFYSWGRLCRSDLSKDGYLVDQNGHRVTTQGWCEVPDAYDNLETYYIKENGKAAVGWNTIDGKDYYFATYDGVLKRTGITNDGYLVDENGAKVTEKGWHQLRWDSGYLYWYYVKEDGKAAKGWADIDGKEYYFNSTLGVLETDEITPDGYLIDHNGAKVTGEGWHQLQNKYDNVVWCYIKSDGKPALGWNTIDGKEYFFNKGNGKLKVDQILKDGYYVDENGVKVSEPGWRTRTDSSGNSYWMYIKNDGKAATGWTTIGGKDYFFDQSNGKLKVDQILKDGYYVDENGVKISEPGWRTRTDSSGDSYWIYIKSDGKIALGWNTINGKEYYFYTYNGKLAVDRILDDGSYVDKTGAKVGEPGWHTMTDSYGESYWIYIKSDGKIALGWNTINGKDYHFTSYSGRLETERITNDGYLVGSDGAVVKGTWAKIWGYSYFYTDSEGRPYKNTWKWIDGKCYYFHEDGRMAANEYIDGNFVDGNGVWIENYVTGTWINDGQGFWFRYDTGGYPWSEFKVINGRTYYFDYYGYSVRGWQWIDGNYYYFEGFGEMVTGWQVIGNTWYYFNADGKMQTGLLNNGYLMQSNGALAVNAWVWTNNNYYYGDSNGIPVKNGWKWINGSWYYFYSDGTLARNTNINGSYVDSSGAWITDQWVYSSYAGKYWYRYANGSYPYSTFKTIGGQTYYFDEAGYMATGWRWIGDSYYYFNASGYMQTGWQVIGNVWYYFNADGKMVTGLQTIEGYQYYFASSGAMQTGWLQLNNEWYYFVSGGWAPKGWQWIDEKWYYFYEDGTMARNVYIEGNYVDWSGVWVA